LFEALQSPVKMIEVREDFPEPLIVLGKPGLNAIEAMVHGLEAPVDLLELPTEELNQPNIFIVGHHNLTGGAPRRPGDQTPLACFCPDLTYSRNRFTLYQ
jgi:hypothetical protein